MHQLLRLTSIIEREGDSYVATCPQFDIVSQGATIDAARLNLVEAVDGFLEEASSSEIQRRIMSSSSLWR